MQALIVHAHPEPQSFCSALKNQAIESLGKLGYQVEVSDLYAMEFDPVGNQKDFTSTLNSAYFKYQAEQVHAYQNGNFSNEISAEMSKLDRADLVIFNFPLWWFGLPAILKGWVDRVFAMGYAYGAGKGVYDNGTFHSKSAMICMTTGGPEVAYGATGKNGDLSTILFPIHHGMFYFTGMTVLPPYVAYAPARASEEERKALLEGYDSYLAQLKALKPLYTATKR